MTPPTETPATAEATPATPETTTPTADPKVAQLKALFPDQSDDILAAVLEAHGGSLEESTETLIAMNSDEPLEAAGNPDEAHHLESDAALARSLAAIDEQESRQQSQQRRNQAPHPPTTPGTLPYQPYVPRRGASARTPQQQSSSQDDPSGGRPRDELDQLSEGFSKLAAQGSILAQQGKKSLGTFFNKVKDEINKLDPPRPGQTSSGQPAPNPPSSQSQGWTPPTALPRPDSSNPRANTATPPPPALISSPQLHPRPSPPATASSSTSTPTAEAATAASSETVSEKKDFSNIPGLLPRQSISLHESSHKGADESDDEEFVRSPFDDD